MERIYNFIEGFCKDNSKSSMMLFRIEYTDSLFKAIMHHSLKYVNDNRRIHIKSKFRKRNDKSDERFYKYIDYGDTRFNYKNCEITVSIMQNDSLIVSDHPFDKLYSEMSFYIRNDINTKEQNEEIAKDFFKEAQEDYDNNVLKKKNEEGKTTVYIWDEDYWEPLEKTVSRKMSTVYLDGMGTKIQKICEEFTSEETKDKYANFGVPYKLNILLHGYPGTGKTSIIYSIASELKMSVALLSFTQKMEDSNFMKSLRSIPDDTILVIEDIDALFESRKKNDEYKNNITFSALLNTLDGMAYSPGQMIFMTTNHPQVLDKALKRPGRVDHSFKFDYANKNQIKKMFETFIPSQLEKFNDFYKQIKNLKLTTSMLQKFFFMNHLCDNIEEKVNELEEMSQQNKFENDNVLYS